MITISRQPISTMKIETATFSETLVAVCEIALRPNPEAHNYISVLKMKAAVYTKTLVNIYENICCHNPQNNKEILT
jgi:hypothetical protein